MNGPLKISAVMTCHNRSETTETCLQSLATQSLPTEVSLSVFMVDDGSTDDTAARARSVFPEVNIIQGNGTLFWCGGMRKAWASAARSAPDYYLLLNDDTNLYPDAIGRLLEICRMTECRAIAVGSTCDPVTGAWTYGGIGPKIMNPHLAAFDCQTMNANCVLVPQGIYQTIGGLYHRYTHSMGDLDYGYMARRNGFLVLETSSFVGTCTQNTKDGTWEDRKLDRLSRFRKLIGPKGLPWKEWFFFTRRNAGNRWIRYFISPYIKILLGR